VRFFTPDEDRFLKLNYKKIPCKRMGKMLGRTEGTARQRLKLLGITVPPEIVEKFKKVGQFKKGQEPPNKGKKMSPEVYKKVKRTFFTKGHAPHNTKFNGYERVSKDGYVEIRVKKGKFKLKHRVIWEQKRGRVPKGMVVIFKDGNKMNLKISNLKLITREENMKRNSYHNYGKEIARVIQLRGALNRQINKYAKHSGPKRNIV
jgi:hypothetical protein